MPNWCDNQVTITGSKSVIDKIEKIAKEEKGAGGLLTFFHPMPKGLEDTTSPSSSAKKPQPMIEGFDNWYDWANHPSNWGTKWGDCNTQLSFDPDYGIEGNFETAWGPLSAEFWEGVSKRFPTLKIAISYSEEGMCFEGGMAFHNGECLYDECTEMSAHMGQARMVLAQG